MADTELTTYDADVNANALFTSLTDTLATPPTFDATDFTIPDETGDLYSDFVDVTIDSLTTCEIEGTGNLDKILKTINLHVCREFDEGRITGDQYAEVYLGAVIAALGSATTFTLQKDQAKWQAIQAQIASQSAEVELIKMGVDLEKTKIETAMAVYSLQTVGAQYALTKIQIANADADYCFTLAKTESEEYRTKHLLPVELAVQQYQRMQVLPTTVELAKIQKQIEKYKLEIDMPIGTSILSEQYEAARAQTFDTRSDNLTEVNGVIGSQRRLLTEQRETERAKTLDTRSDGVTAVVGSVGKQKDLYTQQIDSFIKDAQYKTAKMYLDAFITQKTLDDALIAPTELQNTKVDSVMAANRAANNL